MMTINCDDDHDDDDDDDVNDDNKINLQWWKHVIFNSQTHKYTLAIAIVLQWYKT